MTNSPLPINGKKLADRWNIETIDLMYIILNHGLNVVDQYYDEVDIGDVLEDFKKNKDASDYMFSLSEVTDIENKLEVDDKIPHAETIRGEDLMARWQKHEGEIHSIMFTHGLDVIDPFGHELELQKIFRLITEEVFEIRDLLFRLSDIADLESEYDELEPKQPDQEEDSDPDETEPIPDSEQESIPVISFYKNGDSWLIGEKGKEKTLNHLKGFDLISFLIRDEGKEIDVNVLYDLGKVSTEDSKLNVGNVPYGIKILPQDALDMTYEEDGEKSYSLSNESEQELVDGRAIKEYKDLIEYLSEKLLVETDPLKKIEHEEEIEEIQQHLKKAERAPKKPTKFKNLSKDRVRINVRKLIKTALDKISNDIPELKEILNEDSIRTGSSCCYKPDSSNPVKWILDPEG